MFDSVGKDLDEEATLRSAKAGLISFLLAGGAVVATLAAGMWAARNPVVQAALEEVIEVAMEDEPMLDMAPPPPPPPPPPPAGATDPEETTDETPTPDDMVEEIKDLKEEVKEEVKSDVKPAGVEGGVEGGVAGGVVGGVAGGVVGGVVGGQLGGTGGPRAFHYSEVKVKKRFEPQYPSAARGLNLGEQKCKTKVFVGRDGVPTKAEVSGCPNVFHRSAEEAILQWRWYPANPDGTGAIEFQTTIIFKFIEV